MSLIVVGHSRLNKVLAAHFNGKPLAKMDDINPGTGEWIVLDIEPGARSAL